MTEIQCTDKAKPLAKSKASNEPYRKVKITMWDDPKFRALSPLPASGQSLFVYLLTGPFTGIIPGLYKAGRAAMAEELNWDVEDFDLALGEALALGMVKVDLKARVFWLPNAVKHNPPASVNVIKSWARAFEWLPDCELKIEAFESLRAACYGVSKAMGMAFDKAFALPKDKAKALPSGIQKAVSSKQLLNPEREKREQDEFAGSEDCAQVAAQPFGKFAISNDWLPGADFAKQATLWGIDLGGVPGYSPEELQQFRDYWSCEGKVKHQQQWEQTFAYSLRSSRARNRPAATGLRKSGSLPISQPDTTIPPGFRG
ncbi:DnaT-like ssDNA-binding domain-containing protein [Pseudescherichia vulneris]